MNKNIIRYVLTLLLVFLWQTDMPAQSNEEQKPGLVKRDSVSSGEIDLGEISVEVNEINYQVRFPRIRVNYAPALSKKDSLLLQRAGYGFMLKRTYFVPAAGSEKQDVQAGKAAGNQINNQSKTGNK